ncbi:MAG: NAD(P)/FAD-dependent oxidoreductase [Smithellaceae bacterium]
MKIAVIGAGPGGLFAALAARRQNISVDLFEKRQAGAGIVCGECIFDSLSIFPRPGKGLLRPIQEIIMQGRRGYNFAIGRYRPLWMMDRKTWQRDLARRARDAGAVVHENTAVRPGDLAVMRGSYDWIIDASGAPCVTSRLYSFQADYFHQFLLAYQFVLQGDFGALMPRLKFAFFEDMPARFQPAYYWVFPKDEHTANVGVVCTVNGSLPGGDPDLKNLLGDVLKRENLGDCVIAERGGGIAASQIIPRLVYDNIILAGDAAGLASPLHGGGIDLACLSGVLAVEALSGGPAKVGGYRQRLKDILRERKAVEDIVIRKMRSFSFEQFDRLLAGVTDRSLFTRIKTGLAHPDLLYATIRWFTTKKEIPPWPV